MKRLRTKLKILIVVFILSPIINCAQSDSATYIAQDRTTLFYIHSLDRNDAKTYFTYFSLWDIRYRMSNYKDEFDNFSFTGKIGLQGLSLYVHFGPELKLNKHFFVNTTLGLFAGLEGIGLINETELVFKYNIFQIIYLEGVANLQIYPFGIKDYIAFPSLRIGLGLDL